MDDGGVRKFILEGHEVVPANTQKWLAWFSDADRTVAHDIIKDVSVSTVFLGLDHRFGGDGPPLVFETMVFGGEHDEFCDRYSTWDEALVGHDEAVKMVKG